ncbi:MAG: hypothetical protein RR630_07185 [Coprobacillus sp.]
MKIYKANTLTDKQKHILDPDLQSYDYEQELYSYFKQLTIPHNVCYIIGIYIQFDIDKIIYESNPNLYQKFSDRLKETIRKQLELYDGEILDTNTNTFFITMFDIPEETIVIACLNLHKTIHKKLFYQRTLHIRTGIYFSHSKIKAYQFYKMSKDQFENTLKHDHSVISVKYISTIQ